jgi:acyl-CoA thioesterase-1
MTDEAMTDRHKPNTPPSAPGKPAVAVASYGDEREKVQKGITDEPFTRRGVLASLSGALLAAGVMNGFFPARDARAATQPLRIVALGDSLTAGYQLPARDAFPNQLEAALRERGHKVEIANAGVSGDTTAQGLARLDWSVPDGTDAVIVELGANDALRGLDPAAARKSLDEIVTRLKGRGIAVMLAGMLAPRNLGADYVKAFDSIYPDLARKHEVTLYPFFLEGVTENRAYRLPDGLHPTAEGIAVIVKRILPTVEAFLATLKPRA